jgi:dTDP-4-dehydrorhamnose 3,5-epimerase
VAVELSAENWAQIYVPVGFAHGFCTLTENAEVLYKVSAEYGPAEEGGVLWNDPDLGIAWPIGAEQATLSPRDLEWPRFKDFDSPF